MAFILGNLRPEEEKKIPKCMKWSPVLTLPSAHILYISAHGGTLPVMNLGIQGKMVFVFVSIFESVFVFVFVPVGHCPTHILYIRAHCSMLMAEAEPPCLRRIWAFRFQ